VKRADAKHSAASEHKWAGWQVPPVICPGCGERVTLKQAFWGSFEHGTFHATCLPYRVSLEVECR
jgi:hypothetical protein